jgi:bifunctional UDP-N-acetylglucosamine pyrophosphorylase/glucosamine-1-phosphate N-acetyltransferase
VHLAEAEAAMRRRINRSWMEAGVTLVDPAATTIEPGVTIGRDTVILPNTMLCGATVVGAGCQIGPNSVIENSTVGDRCTVNMSFVRDATLAEGRSIGPFATVQG